MTIESISNGGFDSSVTWKLPSDGRTETKEMNFIGDGITKNKPASQETNERKIKAAVNEVNTKLKHTKARCEFSMHEATKSISIKIIDSETNEVIREVPPEKTLEAIEKVLELAGLLVDEKR